MSLLQSTTIRKLLSLRRSTASSSAREKPTFRTITTERNQGSDPACSQLELGRFLFWRAGVIAAPNGTLAR
jgi:hypothetical protein